MGETDGVDYGKAIADARELGATAMADEMEKRRAADAAKPRILEIEPENADAVRLYLRMQSQWRVQVAQAGKRTVLVRTGFDYAALPAIATALGLALSEAALDGLRSMEDFALGIYLQRQKRGL